MKRGSVRVARKSDRARFSTQTEATVRWRRRKPTTHRTRAFSRMPRQETRPRTDTTTRLAPVLLLRECSRMATIRGQKSCWLGGPRAEVVAVALDIGSALPTGKETRAVIESVN